MKKKLIALMAGILLVVCIISIGRYIGERNEIRYKQEEITALKKKMPYLHYSLDDTNLTLDQKIQFLKSVKGMIDKKMVPAGIQNYEDYPKAGAKVTSRILVTWSKDGLEEVYNVTTSATKGSIKLYKPLWEIQADASNSDKMNTNDESITQEDYDRNKELLEGAPDDD